jgi:hypothetical protein
VSCSWESPVATCILLEQQTFPLLGPRIQSFKNSTSTKSTIVDLDFELSNCLLKHYHANDERREMRGKVKATLPSTDSLDNRQY